MFKAMTKKDYRSMINRDSFFYGDLRKKYSCARECMVAPYYMLVWEVLSREVALTKSREHFPWVLAQDDTRTVYGYQVGKSAFVNLSEKREPVTPIHLWIDRMLDSPSIQHIVDRYSDDNSDLPVWVKYPRFAKSVYEVVSNRLQTFVWDEIITPNRRMLIGNKGIRELHLSAGNDSPYFNQFYQAPQESKLPLYGHQQKFLDSLCSKSRKIQQSGTFGRIEHRDVPLHEYYKSPGMLFETMMGAISAVGSAFPTHLPWDPKEFDNLIPDVIPTNLPSFAGMEGGFKRGEIIAFSAGGSHSASLISALASFSQNPGRNPIMMPMKIDLEAQAIIKGKK